jgi:hypothetical protein
MGRAICHFRLFYRMQDFCSNTLVRGNTLSNSLYFCDNWRLETPFFALKCDDHPLKQTTVIYNRFIERTKKELEKRNMPFASNLGGAAGSIFHDIWMNPCEVVKQRLQMKNSPYSSQNYSQIIKQIHRTEGIKAFYLSFPTQLFMNAMYGFLKRILYTILKQIFENILIFHEP